MRFLKEPYRIAVAGAAVAAGAGFAGAAGIFWICPALRRSSLRPLFWMGLPLGSAALFATLYYPPYCSRRDIVNGVYLTFDDGPDPDSTPKILDALAGARATATFFLLGRNAARYPELVRRLVDEGHAVGIHGFDHTGVTLQSPGRIGGDLDRAIGAVETAAPGCDVSWYRPPFGLRGPGLAAALRRRGLRLSLWTIDSHDYLLRQPDPIRERLASSLHPGDIVLLHDSGESGRATAAGLPRILEDLQARGWRPESL